MHADFLHDPRVTVLGINLSEVLKPQGSFSFFHYFVIHKADLPGPVVETVACELVALEFLESAVDDLHWRILNQSGFVPCRDTYFRLLLLIHIMQIGKITIDLSLVTRYSLLVKCYNPYSRILANCSCPCQLR